MIFEKINQKRIQKKTEEFKKSGVMRYFHYDFGTMAEGMTSYTITEAEGELLMTYQKMSMKDGKEIRADFSMPLTVMQQLKKLIVDENIFLWNGFNKSNSVIASGNSFNLKADFDHYKLKAAGMVMMPTGYDECHEAMSNYLDGLVKTYYIA